MLGKKDITEALDSAAKDITEAQALQVFGYKQVISGINAMFPLDKLAGTITGKLVPGIASMLADELRTDNGEPLELRQGEEKAVFILDLIQLPDEPAPRLYLIKAAKRQGEYHFRPFEKLDITEIASELQQALAARTDLPGDIARLIVLSKGKK